MDQLLMTPPVGERLLRFVGDTVRFALRGGRAGQSLKSGWQARLRTNLGHAALLREEIIRARFENIPFAGASWRDLPMRWENGEWVLTLPLTEVGFFKAKAYLIDPRGYQVWPEGPDFGVSVHPDAYRTANTIYCAFPRLFGASRAAASTRDEKLEAKLNELDEQGFTVIPPSGKLHDLTRELPHIFGALGCRILHLLPVNPTPTTFARMGRFGSPYACGDLTAIDPALVEFDRRTTGVEQFRELTYAAHSLGGKVFLDLVINHTGWDNPLRENHPDWYLRDDQGNFASPGAWGVVWADLVELEQKHPELWECLAEVFLTWCQRGVDGFRCDAGYKVPMPVWQYITARVRQEFPDTVFLLEGLGGGWHDTENLLTEGGMQWAYSELFQNYSGQEVAHYLDYSLRQSERLGLYVHYSETHDNPRLAAKGRAWSLLRNRLCALTSESGGYGFTCGVEWLAAERIRVHGCTGLNWGGEANLLPELAKLNALLAGHPCFFDGAKLTRLSPPGSPVLALLRESDEGLDTVLVLVNNDPARAQSLTLDPRHLIGAPNSGPARPEASNKQFANLEISVPPMLDLLGQAPPSQKHAPGQIALSLEAGAAYCLSIVPPRGLQGDAYRRARARAAWAMQAMGRVLPAEKIRVNDWRALAGEVNASPATFLAKLSQLAKSGDLADALETLRRLPADKIFPQVVTWRLADRTRILPVPPEHWLLVEDTVPFRAALNQNGRSQHVQSIAVADGHIACFPPQKTAGDAALLLERYTSDDRQVEGTIRFLAPEPQFNPAAISNPQSAIALLTNGIGGMARLGVDLGGITSKYDCLLGANLHASLPVDRHVFAKRARVWVNADGFLTALNKENLASFETGPPARWRFLANAGDGRTVEIFLEAEMIEGRNATVLRFRRGQDEFRFGPLTNHRAPLPVSLTVRVDIEDRNFHWETKRNGGTEHHFAGNCHPLAGGRGFAFTPAADRQLRVFADTGTYHHEAEWCENIPHPVEQSRGMTGSGDAYSPGWFELPLTGKNSVTLVITAELEKLAERPKSKAPRESASSFEKTLAAATKAFVVRRGKGKTVIAGYPWFLDWGRDTLISARGLLAAGMTDEVREILLTFARFEEHGTLPNTIHGDNVSNRDTSDAPLWFGMVCEELSSLAKRPTAFARTAVDEKGRPIADVLRSIAANHVRGTPNGIRMDAASGLIWSPSHFTWMDTNFPAGTPREGYPVEIQALWIRLLRQLERLGAQPEGEPWGELAARAEKSFHELFWLEQPGWFADQLIARPGVAARDASPDNALRSNMLFAISLGLVTGERAKRCVDAALRQLVVPGALRSLAPLPVSPPLAIFGNNGQLLNDPPNPYWGRYEGDEDTRRKPAYHNGTAWVWTFPVFCEALARAWDFAPEAVAAARAYLGSVDRLLAEGCIGHLPEIVDGDAPHSQRGCDAQAWSVTEALRVWRLLGQNQRAATRNKSLQHGGRKPAGKQKSAPRRQG